MWKSFLSFACGLVLAFAGCSNKSTAPDVELLADLERYKPELSRLVQMLDEDRDLEHLWRDSMTPKQAIDDGRWDAYRALMDRAGIRGIHNRYGAGSDLVFRLGTLNYRSYDKGFAYSDTPLEPQRESLDLKRNEIAPYAVYYRHVDKNWYLYLESRSE